MFLDSFPVSTLYSVQYTSRYFRHMWGSDRKSSYQTVKFCSFEACVEVTLLQIVTLSPFWHINPNCATIETTVSTFGDTGSAGDRTRVSCEERAREPFLINININHLESYCIAARRLWVDERILLSPTRKAQHWAEGSLLPHCWWARSPQRKLK